MTEIQLESAEKMPTVKHDLICQYCDKPATVNYQLVWVKWDINSEGKFSNQEYKNIDTDEWYCDRCYHKEIEMWDEEDLDRDFPHEEESNDKPEVLMGSGSINDQYEFN